MKPLKAEIINTDALFPCPSCNAMCRVDAFPALIKERPEGQSGETLLIDQEASCYYHPGKKAVVPCDACGRFLCSLCEVEFNDAHLCLPCLEAGKKKGKLKNLENQEILFDNIALYLSIGAVLMWFITFITAPAVIYIVIRYWKQQPRIIPRSRIRFVAAFLIAGVQIAGWAMLIFGFMSGSGVQ